MPTQTVNGHTIYYRDEGQGAPIVCISNSIGDRVDFVWVGPMTEEQVRGSGYRLIMPDYFGLAKSEHSADIDPKDWANDLVGLLDALSIPSADIFSENLSTRVAVRGDADHPDRVKSLVLAASIAKSEALGNQRRNRGYDLATMAEERRERMKYLHGDDWEAVVTAYLKLHDRADFESYYDLYNLGGRVKTPTLIIRGDIDDALHPLKHTLDLHRLIPGSWLRIFPNTTYDARRSHLDEFWRLVSTFLKERALD